MLKPFLKHFLDFSKSARNLRLLIVISVLLSGPAFASAGNITFSPTIGTYTTGKTFSVDVIVSNNQDNINAVSGLINFPTGVLQVVSLSKSGSILGLWAEEPAYSNTNGTISFEGVSLNPGFSGSQGKIITINFKAIQSGKASVVLKSGSVLANDGNATNVLGTLGTALFTIKDQAEQPVVTKTASTPAQIQTQTSLVITSLSYPDTNAWYSSRDASFAWNNPPNVTAVRTLYDENPTGIPSKVFDPAINNRSFTVDTDGVMYMHVQARTSSGWGQTVHYKFQVDSHAPLDVKASFTDSTVTTNPSPTVLITGTDALSGLDHVSISVDGQEPVSIPLSQSNLYHIPKQAAGKHTALITLYDKAGNGTQITLDYTVQVIPVPIITSYTRHVELGGFVEVEGTTYPQTTVEVVLSDSNEKTTSETVVSDEKGNFKLTWKEKLSTGVYEMRVRAIDGQGATSDFTQLRVITLEQLALIRVGIFIMNWLSLVLIIIIAVMAIIGALWYSFLEFTRFRRKIRRTLTDVENTLKTNVQALRRDTEEFHTLLVKAEKKRELSKEEQAILKKFKKRLEITESEIEKKLEQIG
jgi:hypothetical protein